MIVMFQVPLPCIILHLRQAKGWPDSTAPMRFYLLPGKNPTDVFGWGYEEGHQRGCSMHLLLRYAASLGKQVRSLVPSPPRCWTERLRTLVHCVVWPLR